MTAARRWSLYEMGSAQLPGEMFGSYRLDELVGRGGMGEVFRAFDTKKARLVALKRLPASLSGDPGFRARFQREAELTAQLNEPHIIPIHDYGVINDQLFLDMRLVEGTDLAAVLADEGSLDPQRAASIVVQIASALDAAHQAGLIHRDVKPSNVLLTGTSDPMGSSEFAYLIDFGIASSAQATALTAAGSVVGSGAYMAPERFAADGGMDRRGDVYSLGCVLYELLTGRPPFPGSDLASFMGAHLHSPPPAVDGLSPDLAHSLNGVIARALAKDPHLRYPTAGQLAAAARAAAFGTTEPNQPDPVMELADQRAAPSPPGAVTDPAGRSEGAVSATEGAASAVPGRLRRPRQRVVLIAVAVVVVITAAAITLTTFVPQHDSAGGGSSPVAVPTTVAVGVGPMGLAIAPDGRSAYVVNNGTSDEAGNTVSVVDTASDATVATIPVDSAPFDVAFAPDGRRAYVSNFGPNTVSVIDTVRRIVLFAITVGEGDSGGPRGLAVAPNGAHVYVAIAGTEKDPGSRIAVIDTATNAVTASIPVGKKPFALAVTPDGRRLYAVINGTTDTPGANVAVIDTATNSMTGSIPVGAGPFGVAITPDGRRAYVTNFIPNTVSVIDTASNTVAATIPVGSGPERVAVTPDGRHVYVTNHGRDSAPSSTVSVIDTATNTVAAVSPAGAGPAGIAVTPDGRKAYVADNGGNAVAGKTVSVIDISQR